MCISLKEQKKILENIDILIVGFRLLNEKEREIDSGTLEEDERVFGIKKIQNIISRWNKQYVLCEDVHLIEKYFGLFLEALYLYKRYKAKASQRKRAEKLEGIFQKFLPCKVKVA